MNSPASIGRCSAPTRHRSDRSASPNYEGLRFLEAAAERAGSLAFRPLLAAARNMVYTGARGLVTIRDGRAEMSMYLAEADGLDFKLLKML